MQQHSRGSARSKHSRGRGRTSRGGKSRNFQSENDDCSSLNNSDQQPGHFYQQNKADTSFASQDPWYSLLDHLDTLENVPRIRNNDEIDLDMGSDEDPATLEPTNPMFDQNCECRNECKSHSLDITRKRSFSKSHGDDESIYNSSVVYSPNYNSGGFHASSRLHCASSVDCTPRRFDMRESSPFHLNHNDLAAFSDGMSIRGSNEPLSPGLFYASRNHFLREGAPSPRDTHLWSHESTHFRSQSRESSVTTLDITRFNSSLSPNSNLTRQAPPAQPDLILDANMFPHHLHAHTRLFMRDSLSPPQALWGYSGRGDARRESLLRSVSPTITHDQKKFSQDPPTKSETNSPHSPILDPSVSPMKSKSLLARKNRHDELIEHLRDGNDNDSHSLRNGLSDEPENVTAEA